MSGLLATTVLSMLTTQGSALTITSNFFRVSVPGQQTTSSPITEIPSSVLVAASDEDNYSAVQVDNSVSGDQFILSHELSQNRGDGRYALTEVFGFGYFTVDQNAIYELSGYFSVTDLGEKSGRVQLHSYLSDTETNVSLMASLQRSDNTRNESFVLGGTGGDTTYNSFEGSLTGTLLAGRTYKLYLNAFSHQNDQADGGAIAVGNLTLRIREEPHSGVPDSGLTVALLGLALAALAVARRRIV